MGISGDFATLVKMQKRIAATSGAAPRVSQAAAPLLVEETRRVILEGRTLGGRALGDRAATFRRGTTAPLQRSGALLASLEGVAEHSRVGINFAIDYAKYPLRHFFPQQTPASWVRIIGSEAHRIIREILEGKS